MNLVITDTPKQMKRLIAAIEKMSAETGRGYLYRELYGNALADAQQNLSGRTHYVDDDTLRFHKSRVIDAKPDCAGLVYLVLTSDAADPDNRRRVVRVVAFDTFGTVIWRESLDEAATTTAAALRHFAAARVNLTDHYRESISMETYNAGREYKGLKAALRIIGRKPAETTPTAQP